MSTTGLTLSWSKFQCVTDWGHKIVLKSSLPAAVDSVTPHWPWLLSESSEWLAHEMSRIYHVCTGSEVQARTLRSFYCKSFLHQKSSVRWLSLTHKQFNCISHCCLQHTLTSLGEIWKLFSIASYWSSTNLCILWGPWLRIESWISIIRARSRSLQMTVPTLLPHFFWPSSSWQ